MTTFIYFFDYESYMLSYTSILCKMYELIGIYEEYINPNVTKPNNLNNFADFYQTQKDQHNWHYRNIGHNTIKLLLSYKGKRATKKALRKLSLTHTLEAIAICNNFDDIIIETIDYILHNQSVYEVFNNFILNENASNFIDWLINHIYSRLIGYISQSYVSQKKRIYSESYNRLMHNLSNNEMTERFYE